MLLVFLLVGRAVFFLVVVAMFRKGYHRRLVAFVAPSICAAVRWSVCPLFVLSLSFLALLPSPSRAQSPPVVMVAPGDWDPANWYHSATGAPNPCYLDPQGTQVDPNATGDYVGSAGQPSPCSYLTVTQGYMLSDGPAIIKTILSILVVILAIWQGPRVLKRLLLRSAS